MRSMAGHAPLVLPQRAGRATPLQRLSVPPVSEAALLRDAIKASGLSARRFAREVLLRDERTVRRWLAGDSPIPEPVVAYLMQPLASSGGSDP